MTHSPSRARIVRAIVTGHTRGLGAALAEQLLARDIAVLGISRNRHPALAARFAQPSQSHAASHSAPLFTEAELDLADSACVAQWLAHDTLQRFVVGAHGIVLFNNAGTVEPIGPLPAQSAAAIARSVALNVAAPLMFASAVVAAANTNASTDANPGATRTDDCRIVHISSGAARHAYAGWSVYCATKAALDHHARAIALDAGSADPAGCAVRICSIAPGVVDTAMQATIRATSVAHFPQRERFEQLKQRGELSTPEDIARQLIDYALSERFGSTPTADVRELAAG